MSCTSGTDDNRNVGSIPRTCPHTIGSSAVLLDPFSVRSVVEAWESRNLSAPLLIVDGGGHDAHPSGGYGAEARDNRWCRDPRTKDRCGVCSWRSRCPRP